MNTCAIPGNTAVVKFSTGIRLKAAGRLRKGRKGRENTE
jgi:hypothetical protein